MTLAAPLAIVHQTQPTPVSCTATCIAMAIGLPVETLGVELARSLDFPDFGVWLAQRGIWMQRCRDGEPLRARELYLLGVRSLNMVNSDHALLLDTRHLASENPCHVPQFLFDPCRGREGRESYEYIYPDMVLEAWTLHEKVSWRLAPKKAEEAA